MSFDVCPVCQYSDKATSHLQSHAMNKYVFNDKVAVFNSDKEQLIIKSKVEGADSEVWVRKDIYDAAKKKEAAKPPATPVTGVTQPIQPPKPPTVVKEPSLETPKQA